MFMVPYILVTCVQLKVQLDVLFYVLFILLYSDLYMFRVLFAPILRSTTAVYSHRRVYGFGMLVHLSRCEGVPASTCSNGGRVQIGYMWVKKGQVGSVVKKVRNLRVTQKGKVFFE
jgi:hypothetical protein